MKIVLVSKCSLDIEQYVEFKMSDISLKEPHYKTKPFKQSSLISVSDCHFVYLSLAKNRNDFH